MSKSQAKEIYWPMIIVSVIGLVLSFLLLIVDINVLNGLSNPSCNLGSYINCDATAASAYSHIGPIPISLLGIFFFFFIALYGIFTKDLVLYKKTLAWFFVVASIGSLFLFLISIFVIGKLCPYCSLVYITNFVGLFILRKHLSLKFLELFKSSNIISILIAAVAAAVLAGIGFYIMKGSIKPSNIVKEYEVATVHNYSTMFTPYYGSDDAKVEIVVFSDLFCPACKTFMKNLEKLMELPYKDGKKYKEYIRVYYKHYPIDSACNKTGTLHPGACDAAMYSFALLQKGLFWEYEKGLRNVRHNAQNAKMLAERLNRAPLDYAKVKEENIKYVIANIQEARALGVRSTPTWLINKRRMEGSYPFVVLKVLVDHVLQKEIK